MATVAFNPVSVSVSAGPGVHGTPITPSDTLVYSPPLRGIWVGVAGNLAVMMVGDNTPVTLANVPAGWFQAAVVSRVMATNTTATTMIGFQ